MKKVLIVAATVFAMATPAFASQCPMLVQQIDEKLATAELSDEDKAKVMELRNSGEAAHSAGDHAKAETDLNAALALLGTE